MDDEETTNSINVIRCVKRSDLRDLRNKHKEIILGNKRLRLLEVSKYVHNVTVSEFNELLLKLKQKPVPMELLRKIKNSCVNLENIEAAFRNEGAFNSLIQILISNDAQKQLEAAACLTNLSCGPHKCSYKVAKAAGAYLVSFINGNSYFLQDQSAWALANIANDCLECFNIIKSQGVLPALLKALTSPLSDVQSVLFALYSCTKYEDPEVISLLQTDLPKHLLSLIEDGNFNSSAFLDAAFTISNCCFFSVKYSLCIFDIKSLERIVNTLTTVIENSEVDVLVATPFIRCIGFLSCDEKLCEYLASHIDFCRILQTLASAGNINIHLIKEMIWVLNNITVSTNIFKNSTDFMPIINIFNNIINLEKSVTLQVLYYFSILASTNKYVSMQLIQHEIFVRIKCLLESEEKDVTEATRIFLNLYNSETKEKDI